MNSIQLFFEHMLLPKWMVYLYCPVPVKEGNCYFGNHHCDNGGPICCMLRVYRAYHCPPRRPVRQRRRPKAVQRSKVYNPFRTDMHRWNIFFDMIRFVGCNGVTIEIDDNFRKATGLWFWSLEENWLIVGACFHVLFGHLLSIIHSPHCFGLRNSLYLGWNLSRILLLSCQCVHVDDPNVQDSQWESGNFPGNHDCKIIWVRWFADQEKQGKQVVHWGAPCDCTAPVAALRYLKYFFVMRDSSPTPSDTWERRL